MAGHAWEVQKLTKWIIKTDGGSRGNPGPGAAAFVFQSANVTEQDAQFLPSVTVNEAEYIAIINALRFLHRYVAGVRSLFDRELLSTEILDIEILSDSQVVVRHISGIYQCKVESLQPFLAEVHERLDAIRALGAYVVINHIPREENTEADSLCNQVMDLYRARFARHKRN
jgi:ribonuclease HI